MCDSVRLLYLLTTYLLSKFGAESTLVSHRPVVERVAPVGVHETLSVCTVPGALFVLNELYVHTRSRACVWNL